MIQPLLFMSLSPWNSQWETKSLWVVHLLLTLSSSFFFTCFLIQSLHFYFCRSNHSFIARIRLDLLWLCPDSLRPLWLGLQNFVPPNCSFPILSRSCLNWLTQTQHLKKMYSLLPVFLNHASLTSSLLFSMTFFNAFHCQLLARGWILKRSYLVN